MDDDTRGCCKFCGRDLEPGEICTKCLEVGLDPTKYTVEEAAALRAKSNNAFLLNINSKSETVIRNNQWGIGRHTSNELCLNDAYVSRFHSRISREDEQFFLEDLGSTNGTLLNSEVVTSRRPLHNGDKIRIGKSEFVFVGPGVTQAYRLS